ncbi:ATP synthase subunit d, mitochondrial-like [Pecten maximus]|uniref:ATP synthase subunit d, mitochondrial-like n=1 Tax=Pecten maximus TaxID=6579 RepID=UPI001458E630|nr:ATP synthase subunit d, mitochondrial-like [Pecten maximus]
MASKRLAKSVVNWKAFGERVSDANLPYFKKFKLLSDTYSGKVSQLPETLPKIDFAHYKSLGAPAAVVDSLEKAYGSAKVAYPADTNDSVNKIEKKFQEAKKEREAYVSEENNNIKQLTDVVEVCKKAFPPKDEWTLQLYTAYFPDCIPNPQVRPTIFPHTMLNEDFFGDVAHQSQAYYDFDLASMPLYRMPYKSSVQNEYVKSREPDYLDTFSSIGYTSPKEEADRLKAEWPARLNEYKTTEKTTNKKFWQEHEEGKEAFREIGRTVKSLMGKKKDKKA